MSAGLRFGLITMLVQYVGLFMLGFHTGLLVGLVGLCGLELYYIPPSAWFTLGVLLAAGLVFALLTLYFQVRISWAVQRTEYYNVMGSSSSFRFFIIKEEFTMQKSLTILGSALYGGAVIMTTTDFFIENSLVLTWVWERVKVDRLIDRNLRVLDTVGSSSMKGRPYTFFSDRKAQPTWFLLSSDVSL